MNWHDEREERARDYYDWAYDEAQSRRHREECAGCEECREPEMCGWCGVLDCTDPECAAERARLGRTRVKELESDEETLLVLARECRCCPDCWDVPCGGCQAGGVCDDICHCLDVDDDEWGDDEWGDE